MRQSSKALPLNRLLSSLLCASALAMTAMPALAQDNVVSNNQTIDDETIAIVTLPQVMHVDTLVGLQALQFNLKRRHIDLSDRRLLAQKVDEQLPSNEQRQHFDVTSVSFDDGDAVK